MSDKKINGSDSSAVVAPTFDQELEKSFEDTFDPEEIRAIQEEINRKFQSDSDLSRELDDRIHTSIPQKRSQRIPLSVSIPSIVLLVFSAILLFEPASSSETTVFSLLFPSVARDAVTPDDVNLTQVTRVISDEQSEQRFEVILGRISQERALDYFTETQEVAAEQEDIVDEEPEAIETKIEAIQESIAEATEEIAAFEDSEDTSESEVASIVAPTPTLLNFDALRAEQEQYEALISQYSALTDRVRDAVTDGNINVIENRLSVLQSYIGTLSARDSNSIELIVESGNRYILTVQEVITALRLANENAQQQGSLSQEYIGILEDAQQQYLQLGRQVRNAIVGGNANALERSINSLETYIGSLSADDGRGIASLISSGQDLVENGRRYLEQINQLADLNSEITTLEDDLQQARDDLASFQSEKLEQDAITSANLQSQDQQITSLNQQVSNLNSEIATLQDDLQQARQSLASFQTTQLGQDAITSANLQSQGEQIATLTEQITSLQSQVVALTNQSQTYQASGRLCESDLSACKRSVTQ